MLAHLWSSLTALAGNVATDEHGRWQAAVPYRNTSVAFNPASSSPDCLRSGDGKFAPTVSVGSSDGTKEVAFGSETYDCVNHCSDASCSGDTPICIDAVHSVACKSTTITATTTTTATVSTTTTTISTTTSTTATTSTTSSALESVKAAGMSTGAVTGIGAIAGILLIGGAAVAFYLVSRKAEATSAHNGDVETQQVVGGGYELDQLDDVDDLISAHHMIAESKIDHPGTAARDSQQTQDPAYLRDCADIEGYFEADAPSGVKPIRRESFDMIAPGIVPDSIAAFASGKNFLSEWRQKQRVSYPDISGVRVPRSINRQNAVNTWP